MPTRRADPIADSGTRPPPMEQMLRNLPAQHREILVATYFHHRTPDEAARQLGLAPAVAKGRLYEAMRNLSLMLTTSRPDGAPR